MRESWALSRRAVGCKGDGVWKGLVVIESHFRRV